MSTLSDRIKFCREQFGYSQARVSKDLGISQSTLGNYEAEIRKPDADMLVRLADYFDVSVDYLLGRTDHPNLKIITAPTEFGEVVLEVDRDGPDELTQEELAEVRRILRERREKKQPSPEGEGF